MWCPNGHTSIYEPWDWLVSAIDSSQPTMVVGRLDQYVFTCCEILGPFCGILDKSVWRWASLTVVSLLLYNKHVSCSNLQQPEPWGNSVALRCAKASRWSASLSWKAPTLLSGRGLSYNHSQRTHGRLLELDISKIEKGTAVVINNLWSIPNTTKAKIDIAITHCPICLAGWLIFMHLELFLPLALSFMTTSQGWWHDGEIQGRYRHHLHEPGPEMCFVMSSLPDLRTHLKSVLVCGDDADVFILLFLPRPSPLWRYHGTRCQWQEQLEMHKCQWPGKENRPTSEWDISICCTVVQNLPKIVYIYSSPHFYSRYVDFWLPSMGAMAVTIQYYSMRTERTCLSSWWWVNRII